MPSEQRRRQILAVARDQFAAGGYRTTTAQVARAAGVSEALVIKHFASKDVLFRAAVAEPLVAALEERRRFLDQIPPPRLRVPFGAPRDHVEWLRAVGYDYVDLVTANRDLILGLARDAHHFPDVIARVLALIRSIADELAGAFGSYADTDDYRGVDAWVATYAGLGALTLGALLTDEPRKFVDEYYDMAYHGLLSAKGRTDVPERL
jgi:AcrR family transcriptional regulator